MSENNVICDLTMEQNIEHMRLGSDVQFSCILLISSPFLFLKTSESPCNWKKIRTNKLKRKNYFENTFILLMESKRKGTEENEKQLCGKEGKKSLNRRDLVTNSTGMKIRHNPFYN